MAAIKGVGMNFQGIIIGAIAFFIIGVFHPIVIKSEYYFGTKVWPVFLLTGISAATVSLFINNVIGAAVLGVFGFASMWGVRELFEQKERVSRGWFPKKPERGDSD